MYRLLRARRSAPANAIALIPRTIDMILDEKRQEYAIYKMNYFKLVHVGKYNQLKTLLVVSGVPYL